MTIHRKVLANSNQQNLLTKARTEDLKFLVKKACQALTQQGHPHDLVSVESRLALVRLLENILKTEFINTRDLKRKVSNYLGDYDFRRRNITIRIRKARKKKHLTQKQLATELGYISHVPIAQFENGSRYPSKRVFQWLEEIGM